MSNIHTQKDVQEFFDKLAKSFEKVSVPEKPVDPMKVWEIKKTFAEFAKAYDPNWSNRLERAKAIYKNADECVIMPVFDKDIDLVMWAESEPPYESEVI